MAVFLIVIVITALVAYKRPYATVFLPLVLMFLVSLWAVLEARFNYSPDEMDHVAAVNYYASDRWMPPEIGADEARIAERPHYATTYLYTHDKTYLILGKLGVVFGKSSADDSNVVFFRLLSWIIATAAVAWLAWINPGAVLPLAVLPQFFYFSTYVNGEGLAIAAAVSGFAAALLFRRTNQAVFAGLCALIAFAAIFLKPSFYIIHIFNAALVIVHAAQIRGLLRALRAPGFFILFCLGAAILGIFLWMEVTVYGSDTICAAGIGKCDDLAAYQSENATRAMDSIVANSGASRLDMLLTGHWVWSSLKSLVGVFGYMTNPIARSLIFVSLILLSAYFVYTAIFHGRTRPVFAILLLLSIGFVVFLSIEYSYSYDYQPQGRYIVAAAMLLSFYGPLSNWASGGAEEQNAQSHSRLHQTFLTAFTVWGVWMACAYAYRMSVALQM